MAVNLSTSLKNKGLNKVFRESGTSNKIKVCWYSTSTSTEGTRIDLEFNAAGSGKVTLKSAVSLAVAKGHIVNRIRLYDTSTPSMKLLATIILENGGGAEEIGDYTNSAGTYQINTFEISF